MTPAVRKRKVIEAFTAYFGAEPERGTVEQMPARGTLRNYVTVHAPLVRPLKRHTLL